jgi:hypothetical protein
MCEHIKRVFIDDVRTHQGCIYLRTHQACIYCQQIHAWCVRCLCPQIHAWCVCCLCPRDTNNEHINTRFMCSLRVSRGHKQRVRCLSPRDTNNEHIKRVFISGHKQRTHQACIYCRVFFQKNHLSSPAEDISVWCFVFEAAETTTGIFHSTLGVRQRQGPVRWHAFLPQHRAAVPLWCTSLAFGMMIRLLSAVIFTCNTRTQRTRVAYCHARDLDSLCRCAKRLYHRCVHVYFLLGLLLHKRTWRSDCKFANFQHTLRAFGKLGKLEITSIRNAEMIFFASNNSRIFF